MTYNLHNTYKWCRPRIKFLEDEGHDSTDFHAAIDRGYQWGDEIPVGVFWRRDDLSSLNDLEPVLSEGGPLAFRPLGLSPDQSNRLISEMM